MEPNVEENTQSNEEVKANTSPDTNVGSDAEIKTDEGTEEDREIKEEPKEEERKETEPRKIKRPNMPVSHIYCISGGIFAFLVQTASVVLYSAGIFSVFGRNMTIVSAMEFILLIFNINKAVVYQSIFGMLLGLLYYVLLGFMLKGFVMASVNVMRLLLRRKQAVSLYGKRREEFPAESYFRLVAGECLFAFEAMCIFMVVASSVTETGYGSAFVFLSVAFGAVAILRALQKPIEKKERAVSLLMSGLKECFIFLALALMIYFLRVPCVKTFVEGCSVLFKGNLNTSESVRVAIASIYSSLLAPVLLCAAQIVFLRLLDVYRYCWDMSPPRRNLAILLLIVLISGLVVRCILVSATGSVGIDTFIGWLNTVKNTYLPLLLLVVMLLLFHSLYGEDGKLGGY